MTHWELGTLADKAGKVEGWVSQGQLWAHGRGVNPCHVLHVPAFLIYHEEQRRINERELNREPQSQDMVLLFLFPLHERHTQTPGRFQQSSTVA